MSAVGKGKNGNHHILETYIMVSITYIRSMTVMMTIMILNLLILRQGVLKIIERKGCATGSQASGAVKQEAPTISNKVSRLHK